MAILTLRILGAFELRDGAGREVPVSAKKNRGLLAILALAPSITREQLANLLWSDRDDLQARNSLRQALASLRGDLAGIDPLPLVSDDNKLSLDHAAIDVDAVAFRKLASCDDPDSLSRAMDLYRGELLADVTIVDPAFEQWIRGERVRLHDLATSAAEKLWAIEKGRNRVKLAKRLVEFEPFKEQSHLSLMQSYVDVGEASMALQHYFECSRLLKAELGIKPGRDIEALRLNIVKRISPPQDLMPPQSDELEPAAPLTDKPSIAVLPFLNLSGDPQQEYFGDGIVEEITIALSRMPSLFVIARNSSFSYKGRSVDIRQVGQELGVRYVLEGSVRKAADRVRIGGQLVDAATGTTLWADRFEGDLGDIFKLQDEITSNVVGRIAPRLEMAEIGRALCKPTGSLGAYDHYLRGVFNMHKWTREGNNAALGHFRSALGLDPNYAVAYGLAARTYVQRATGGWMDDYDREAAEAERMARRAIALGPDDAIALSNGGFALSDIGGHTEDGDAYVTRALRLNPNLATAWLFSGWVKASKGEADLALEHLAQAQRLSPNDPQDFSRQSAMSFAYFVAGRYAEALVCAEAADRIKPNFLFPLLNISICAALVGRDDLARSALTRVRAIDPTLRMSLASTARTMRPEDFARWQDGLCRAVLLQKGEERENPDATIA